MLCLAGRDEVAERIRQTEEIYRVLSHPRKALHIFEADEGAEDHNQKMVISAVCTRLLLTGSTT